MKLACLVCCLRNTPFGSVVAIGDFELQLSIQYLPTAERGRLVIVAIQTIFLKHVRYSKYIFETSIKKTCTLVILYED